MADIVSVTFAQDGANPALVLRNEEYLRALPWGTQWRRIRIAIQMSLSAINNPTGLGFPFMFIGVCQGINGVLASRTTTAACGIAAPSVAGSAMTFSTQYSAYYSVQAVNAVYKIGSTFTQAASGNFSQFVQRTDIDPLDQRRSIHCVDIEKTGSGPRIKYTVGEQYSSYGDYTKDAFLDAAEQFQSVGAVTAPVAPYLNLSTMGYNATTALSAVYDSATTLLIPQAVVNVCDTLNIAWRHANPGLELYGIAVIRQN